MLPASEDGLIDPPVQADEPTPSSQGKPVHIDPVLAVIRLRRPRIETCVRDFSNGHGPSGLLLVLAPSLPCGRGDDQGPTPHAIGAERTYRAPASPARCHRGDRTPPRSGAEVPSGVDHTRDASGPVGAVSDARIDHSGAGGSGRARRGARRLPERRRPRRRRGDSGGHEVQLVAGWMVLRPQPFDHGPAPSRSPACTACAHRSIRVRMRASSSIIRCRAPRQRPAAAGRGRSGWRRKAQRCRERTPSRERPCRRSRAAAQRMGR